MASSECSTVNLWLVFRNELGNSKRNLREFTDQVAVLGAIGDDASGKRLRDLVAGEKIELLNSAGSPGVSTIVKTRIIARHQQVVRVDREQITTLSPEDAGAVAAAVRKKM